MMQQIISQLKIKRRFSLKSQGQSMLPTIHPHDVVSICKTHFHKIKVNNIILGQKAKKAFIHRVIYKNAHFLITKGDNNRFSDGKVYPHHVIGKVYQIKRNGQVFRPEDIYLLQSTLYFEEIVRVKKAFEKENINFVFLKGLPLHLFIQKSHPQRLYADCDILVHPKDYHKVQRIFHKLGYTSANAAYSRIHRVLKDKPTEISFHKQVYHFPILFDVHVEPVFLMNQLGRLDALYPQKLIDDMTEEFLETKRTIKIQNNIFSILSTEYLILYLALHFFHHNYRGIFRLELINKVIRSRGILRLVYLEERSDELAQDDTWKQLQNDIVRFRVQNFVYPVFILLRKLYRTPIPSSLMRSIKPSFSLNTYHLSLITSSVFDDETRIEAGVHRFKNLFYLSPAPLYKKILIFITPSVIYSIVWTLWNTIILRGKLFFLKLTPSKAHSYLFLLFFSLSHTFSQS